MAASIPPRAEAATGDDMDGVYLARIADLEEEVRNLKAELATQKALAHAGGAAGLAKPATPGVLDVVHRQPEPPILVTADGSQGMRRGVSDGRSRSSADADAER